MRLGIVLATLACILVVLAAGCTRTPTNVHLVKINASPVAPVQNRTGGGIMEQSYTKERVELTASDDTKLVGSYYDGGEKGLVLLHQLDRDRATWDAFARQAQRDGYSAITIDFRGHGESQGSWRAFTDKDFQNMLLDANAAATYLRERGKRVSAILGASIGANTAFRYSSVNRVPAVLLSLGLVYHGIDIDNVTSNASTLIVVAQGDTYAYSSSKELEQNNLFGHHELVTVPGANHGTDMLTEGNVTPAIFSFLEKNGK